MVEQSKPTVSTDVKTHTPVSAPNSDKTMETKKNTSVSETKQADVKPKKKDEKQTVKKEFAIARGTGLHISKRHGMYISKFIKGKNIDRAIMDLEQVQKLRLVVPFKGEIPHRKGRGMMSGRYPVKASGIVINVLKALKGNAIVNGLDMNKTIITESVSNWASRPAKSDGRYAKRTHLVITAREKK